MAGMLRVLAGADAVADGGVGAGAVLAGGAGVPGEGGGRTEEAAVDRG